VSIGLALYGLLVAGQGFYADVAWHIALGRDDELLTAPHSGILLGLVMILGAAVVGTLVATFEGIEGRRLGALRVPPALVPLWALGLGAVAGFPLDEVWHEAYGVDVTMWSPTHMLMILGATFTGLAAWLVLSASGVRPTDGPWARGAHLVCAWLTIQGLLAPLGEFTFGVPQFNLLFSPILISLAAGLALVAIRIVHGRFWMLGLVVVNLLLQMGDFVNGGGGDSPVDVRFGATFVASAVVVELVGLVLGTERRLRFALVSGVGIGTVGLAGEHVWNSDAWQPWSDAIYPEALVLAALAATGAAVLGVVASRALRPDVEARRIPGPAVAAAALACIATILVPMRRPTGAVEASITVEPAAEGTAFITATLSPPDAADDASWFQASAWQGGGLELGEMEPTGNPGEFRSDQAMPIDGHWKTLLRLHRDSEMMAVPVFLPADPEIDEAEIPAVDRTAPFRSERDYLLRETHDGNGWLSPVIHLTLVGVATMWALAFVVAVRDGGGSAGRVSPPQQPSRRSAAAAAT
jgi:hypothetical protein